MEQTDEVSSSKCFPQKHQKTTIKQTNICITRKPGEEKKEHKKIFEEIMANNIQKA